MKNRDVNILKNYKREVNLQTKKMKNKKAYTRKTKHKNARFFDKKTLTINLILV